MVCILLRNKSRNSSRLSRCLYQVEMVLEKKKIGSRMRSLTCTHPRWRKDILEPLQQLRDIGIDAIYRRDVREADSSK